MQNINQFLQELVSTERYNINGFTGKKNAERVVCSDDFSVSIQASIIHYSIPRNDFGPYNAFELGFPSEDLVELEEYAEDPNDLMNTVYAYVPIDMVIELIESHGGVNITKNDQE